MQDKFTLKVAARSDVGKGASRRLRRADKVPSIVYGINKEPASLTLDHREISRALENEAFYSHILTLVNDGKTERVVLKDVQRHPYRPKIMHVDFQRISDTEKLIMNIPLHFIGAEVAPGVKVGGGLVAHLMSEIAVRCLPKNLPEYIEVDLSKLELNQAIHLSELTMAKGVEIVDLAHGEDKPVANVYIPRAIVEEAPVAKVEAVAAEGAAEGEAKAGAEAAAGKEKSAAGGEKKGGGK